MKQTAEDLDEFLNKVRKGGHASNEEILSFAKLFNDELTLDNMNRSRLVNMCKYMGIQPFGTDHYLRFMLRKKLQEYVFQLPRNVDVSEGKRRDLIM
uniref:Letm1 RBD domain-containing protein n=1 Tax=Arundo donax TaxID=35708 RepID=A0A0A9DPT7_ARUDO